MDSIEVLISYDISHNKSRTMFYNYLKDLGLTSVQKSLFYGLITYEGKEEIENNFKLICNQDEDKLLITKVNLIDKDTVSIGFPIELYENEKEYEIF